MQRLCTNQKEWIYNKYRISWECGMSKSHQKWFNKEIRIKRKVNVIRSLSNAVSGRRWEYVPCPSGWVWMIRIYFAQLPPTSWTSSPSAIPDTSPWDPQFVVAKGLLALKKDKFFGKKDRECTWNTKGVAHHGTKSVFSWYIYATKRTDFICS